MPKMAEKYCKKMPEKKLQKIPEKKIIAKMPANKMFVKNARKEN